MKFVNSTKNAPNGERDGGYRAGQKVAGDIGLKGKKNCEMVEKNLPKPKCILVCDFCFVLVFVLFGEVDHLFLQIVFLLYK